MLVSVTVPSSVKNIEDGAFSGCTMLVEIINKSDLNIVVGSDEYGNIAVNAIEVHSGESKIVNINGYLFYPCEAEFNLFGYLGTDKDIVLPDSCNGQQYTIRNKAFASSGITSVIIPNTVTGIGVNAFASCESLASVTIGNGVNSIGVSAFRNCKKLTDINFLGSKDQWLAIAKKGAWNSNTGNYVIHCSDGDIAKA